MEAQLDALHFEGPGTDLTVGLFSGCEWETAGTETIDGIPHMANLPSEEIFTTPDPDRTEGVVASTRPLALFALVCPISFQPRSTRVSP